MSTTAIAQPSKGVPISTGEAPSNRQAVATTVASVGP